MGIVVQVQKIRNIGMPVQGGGGSADEDEVETKVERFENKYLEATELGKQGGKWGGKE